MHLKPFIKFHKDSSARSQVTDYGCTYQLVGKHRRTEQKKTKKEQRKGLVYIVNSFTFDAYKYT